MRDKKSLTLRIDTSMHEGLTRRAEVTGESVSALIRKSISRMIAENCETCGASYDRKN